MEIEIFETESQFEQIDFFKNKNEKFDAVPEMESDLSIPVKRIEIFLKYFICSVCEEYFDSENKLERHKQGMSFNLSEISTEF